MARDYWATETIPEPSDLSFSALSPNPWYGAPMVRQRVRFAGTGDQLDTPERGGPEREATYALLGEEAEPGQLLCLVCHGGSDDAYIQEVWEKNPGTDGYRAPNRVAVVLKVKPEAEAAWRLGGQGKPQWYRAVKNPRKKRKER